MTMLYFVDIALSISPMHEDHYQIQNNDAYKSNNMLGKVIERSSISAY